MTSERGLQCDCRSLPVAYLAYENHVRILSQYRPERRRESESSLLMNLNLNDSGNPILDWIFHRDDVDAPMQQELEGRVKSGRLAGAGWAGDEDQSLTNIEQLLHTRPIDGIESKRFHRSEGRARVEDPDDHFFAVRRWQGRDAQINASAVNRDPRTTSLRPQSIGNVHLRHDLDP